ncbi:MAG: hypothetical protein RL235_1111 [Chlamydiota bacterium]|jgi:hypothetical protein
MMSITTALILNATSPYTNVRRATVNTAEIVKRAATIVMIAAAIFALMNIPFILMGSAAALLNSGLWVILGACAQQISQIAQNVIRLSRTRASGGSPEDLLRQAVNIFFDKTIIGLVCKRLTIAQINLHAAIADD